MSGPLGQLDILSIGPAASVQDLGRPGFAAFGLPCGGAADRRALYEAAALLGQPQPQAALELPFAGGRFRASQQTRIALTGAPCPARIDGQPLRWNASHSLNAGDILEIGPPEAGIYAYLSLAGGVQTPLHLGARATLAASGLGRALASGQSLPFAADPAPRAALLALPLENRFSGGGLRVMPGPQSALFDAPTTARAYATAFTAGPANRQGVALLQNEGPFKSQTSALLSDFIAMGDIQSTGAGNLTILLADCQTIGGYPRLGTVLPADLPRAAQARPGTPLRLSPISLPEAEAASPPEALWLPALRRALHPLQRQPQDIADLLSYTLISGVVRGDEEDSG